MLVSWRLHDHYHRDAPSRLVITGRSPKAKNAPPPPNYNEQRLWTVLFENKNKIDTKYNTSLVCNVPTSRKSPPTMPRWS